jgi:hypothetical protein
MAINIWEGSIVKYRYGNSQFYSQVSDDMISV